VCLLFKNSSQKPDTVIHIKACCLPVQLQWQVAKQLNQLKSSSVAGWVLIAHTPCTLYASSWIIPPVAGRHKRVGVFRAYEVYNAVGIAGVRRRGVFVAFANAHLAMVLPLFSIVLHSGLLLTATPTCGNLFICQKLLRGPSTLL